VGHIIDVSATFREITGAKYPEEILGKKTKSPLGKSLLSIFKGKERKPHKEIFWRFNRANAVRQGDLKVVRAGKTWELYDLKSDPTEMKNLAKEMPKKTAELAQMWEDWNDESKIRPK
jgi:arylsulfatase